MAVYNLKKVKKIDVIMPLNTSHLTAEKTTKPPEAAVPNWSAVGQLVGRHGKRCERGKGGERGD